MLQLCALNENNQNRQFSQKVRDKVVQTKRDDLDQTMRRLV